MRKPFKKTVEEVEKVYNDHIKKFGYTDNIGHVIKNKLGYDIDYASNIWRMANKLRDHGLYDKAFNDSKNPRGWTQHVTRYMVDEQIKKYDDDIKELRQIKLKAITDVWNDKPMSEEELEITLNEKISKEIPRLKAKYFDVSLVPDRSWRKTKTTKVIDDKIRQLDMQIELEKQKELLNQQNITKSEHSTTELQQSELSEQHNIQNEQIETKRQDNQYIETIIEDPLTALLKKRDQLLYQKQQNK